MHGNQKKLICSFFVFVVLSSIFCYAYCFNEKVFFTHARINVSSRISGENVSYSIPVGETVYLNKKTKIKIEHCYKDYQDHKIDYSAIVLFQNYPKIEKKYWIFSGELAFLSTIPHAFYSFRLVSCVGDLVKTE